MKQEIKDYECPYCHKHFLMTRGGLYNHIRWCEDNPKSKINKEHLIEIYKIKHQQYLENLENQKKEYIFYCKECNLSLCSILSSIISFELSIIDFNDLIFI